MGGKSWASVLWCHLLPISFPASPRPFSSRTPVCRRPPCADGTTHSQVLQDSDRISCCVLRRKAIGSGRTPASLPQSWWGGLGVAAVFQRFPSKTHLRMNMPRAFGAGAFIDSKRHSFGRLISAATIKEGSSLTAPLLARYFGHRPVSGSIPNISCHSQKTERGLVGSSQVAVQRVFANDPAQFFLDAFDLRRGIGLQDRRNDLDTYWGGESLEVLQHQELDGWSDGFGSQ